MKTKMILTLACVAAMGLVGCSSNKSANMGATSGKTECTDKAGCSGDKSACTKDKAAGSMGAVSGEKKAGCCSSTKSAN